MVLIETLPFGEIVFLNAFVAVGNYSIKGIRQDSVTKKQENMSPKLCVWFNRALILTRNVEPRGCGYMRLYLNKSD